ncbi:branched-chain amino acid ABC transporter permease [Dactylosporangium fulvum]
MPAHALSPRSAPYPQHTFGESPLFLQDAINTVSLASIYLLFATGMSLVWGTTGILNFAHGSLFLASIYAAHIVALETTLSFVGAMIVGVVVGAVLAVVLYIGAFNLVLRRVRDKASAELQILIAGIGFDGLLVAIIARNTLSEPFGLSNTTYRTVTYDVFGAFVTNTRIYVVILALALTTAIGVWAKRTRSGLAMRAIGVDPEIASLMGVNRGRMTLMIMAISGALAGLTGVLLVYVSAAVVPTTGTNLLIKGFAIVVLGGVGSMTGVVVGALTLALAETIINTYTPGSWVNAVAFGLILVVLLLRPQGLFGKKEVRRT